MRAAARAVWSTVKTSIAGVEEELKPLREMAEAVGSRAS